jgi:hypothetical protein
MRSIRKIVSNKEVIEDYYRDKSRISQSSLKTYFLSKSQILNKELKERSSHLIIGSAVDIFYSGAILEDYMEILPVNSTDLKLTPSEIILVSNIHNKYGKRGYEDFIDSGIVNDLDIYKDFMTSMKIETKIEKVKSSESIKNYLNFTNINKGKEYIFNDELTTARNVCESLHKNINLDIMLDDNKNYVFYFQLPLKFELYGEKCKALLDLVICELDDYNKVVKFIPFDLKTTGSHVMEFSKSVRKFRYDIQAAFYELALYDKNTIFPEDFPKIDEKAFENKSNFYFIVESTEFTGFPKIFTLSSEMIEDAKKGYESKNGIEWLMACYNYEKFNLHSKKEYIEVLNNGIITINSNGRYS